MNRRLSVSPDTPPASRLSSGAVLPPEPEGMAPRADALPPGTRLEEYEIERVIGSSGFALVYLANDEAFERRVAIKEYLPDTLAVRGDDSSQVMLRAASHAEAFERGRRAFLEEAQLLARCDHPSLMHVLRSWEANGTVYRAMPYYPGKSLLALRQAMADPPDEASLRALLDGLLDALQALHEAGGLHREITPARILLLPDDRPVLLDSGAARRAIVGDQARALMTLLAPSFAAPEQTAPSPERRLGPWTDLYALAAVVQFCISGELPPPASLFNQAAREPMDQLVNRLRQTHPGLHFSASFRCAIDAALAVHPDDRPQSVAALRKMLDNHPAALAERGETPEQDEAPAAPAAPAMPPVVLLPLPDLVEPALAAGPVAAPVPAPAPAPIATPTTPPRTPAPVAAPARAQTPEPEPPPPPIREPSPRLAPATTPGPARAEPVFNTPPRHEPRRVAPILGFADAQRRRKRRVALSGAALALAVAGVAIWVVGQQRLSGEAQGDLARAARDDGLIANVPTVPAPVESPPAAAPTTNAGATLPDTPTAAVATSGTQAPAVAPPEVSAKATPPEEPPAARAPAAPSKKPATRRAGSARQSTATVVASSERHGSPRDACGNRTQFSLYRCMQKECAQARWTQHPLCKRLRARDEVD